MSTLKILAIHNLTLLLDHYSETGQPSREYVTRQITRINDCLAKYEGDPAIAFEERTLSFQVYSEEEFRQLDENRESESVTAEDGGQRYLVISYDADEQVPYFDYIIEQTDDAALERMAELRPYALPVTTFTVGELDNESYSLLTIPENEIRDFLTSLESELE